MMFYFLSQVGYAKALLQHRVLILFEIPHFVRNDGSLFGYFKIASSKVVLFIVTCLPY